jgi:predicted DCC family thiol-disulfide oxidoreductase YuxK
MTKHVVLYDDECPMCTFQMKVLSWLDWCNALALVPLSDPHAREIAPQLTREDLLEAIHCVTGSVRESCAGEAPEAASATGAQDSRTDPARRIYRGARAIRFVGMRLPLLVPVALVLWIPGVIQIAELIYAWVSRNRHLLSRVFGCKDACAVMPARKREHDKLA